MQYRFLTIRLSLLIVCAFLAMTTISHGQLRIRFITPELIGDQPFRRISEYFTYEENTGNRVIMRTDPEERSGMYFITTLNQFAYNIPQGAKVIIQYYHKDKLKPYVHTLDFPYEMAQQTLTVDLHVGITGKDWPGGPPSNLVAWNIRIEDPAGDVLAEEGSYLWDRVQ